MKKALLLILILPFSLQNLNAQNTDEILDIFSKIKTELGLGESIQKHTISHKKKELSQLSSVELSIKLDSVINQVDGPNESSLTNNFKTEFSYDGEGELIEYKEYSYDTDLDEWVGTWRVSQGFETSDKFVIYGYDWNEQGNDWIYNLKYDINYNNEKVVEEIGYYWEDEATDWIQDSYITYEYDMNGNIASLIEGEIEYGIVIFEIKAESQYNANGDVVESMVYYREDANAEWILYLMIEDTYTYSGEYITEHINNEYYYEYGEVDTVTRTSSFVYDGNNNLTEHLYNFTDNRYETLMDYTEKYEYSYDANNFRTEYIFSTSENNPSLLFDDRIVYEILNDNYVKEIGYRWDNNNQSWNEIGEAVFDYDPDYENDEVVLPKEDIGLYFDRELKSHNVILNIFTEVNNIGNIWRNNQTYFYSDFDPVQTAINDVINTETLIYPNPSNGTLNLEIKNSSINNAIFNLYSSDGKLLISKKLINDVLDMSDLKEGIYFYSVEKKDKVIGSGKLIRK